MTAARKRSFAGLTGSSEIDGLTTKGISKKSMDVRTLEEPVMSKFYHANFRSLKLLPKCRSQKATKQTFSF